MVSQSQSLRFLYFIVQYKTKAPTEQQTES